MNLRSQRRMAGDILKVGKNKVYLDPQKQEEISGAITREDIRDLIKEGVIAAKPKKGCSRGRVRQKILQKKKGRREGQGSRKGTKKARNPKKKAWMNKIRAIRDELRKLRDDDKVDKREYRQLYVQSKGGLFQSRRHLREHIEKLRK